MSVDPALLAAHARPIHRPTLQLLIAWDGSTFVDESAHVLSASGVESLDDETRTLNAAEANVVLDNTTRRFSADNTASPIYPYLRRVDHCCRLRLGWDGSLATVGTFWIDELTPADSEHTVALRMLDLGARWANRRVSYGPAGYVRLDEVARAMLLSHGFIEGRDFVLDVATSHAPYAVAVDHGLFAELQRLAFAEGGRCVVDPDGVLRWRNAANHRAALATPSATFLRSEVAYEISTARTAGDIVTRVELEYEHREDAVADEIVWMAVTPIGVAAATTWEEWEWAMTEDPPGTFTTKRNATPTVRRTYGVNSIVVRGMDRTRWERSLPLEFGAIAAITANSAADGSGTAIAIAQIGGPPPAPTAPADTLHVWWQPQGSSGTLTFFNQRATPVYVRTLTINGRPSRTASPWAVSVVDQEGLDLHGDVGLRIANPYLPSPEVARERGREMLFFRSGMRARLDLPALDGIPFLHPYDAFAFTDDSLDPPVTTGLMVVRHEWSYSERGYLSALRCAPGLPPTDESTSDVVPPGAETITTATAAPPWSWANPYATADVFAVDDPRPWAAETIAGYPANRAILAVAEGDAPAGNPVPRSLRLTLT
ncbi:MAG TPA: hypothetical protein VLH81_05595, partial [Desulfobacterales bacterium]|nr:hypothetical protein [Desulfobacterales bacterium]